MSLLPHRVLLSDRIAWWEWKLPGVEFTFHPKEPGFKWTRSWHMETSRYSFSIDWDRFSSDWPLDGKIQFTIEKEIGDGVNPHWSEIRRYGGYK